MAETMSTAVPTQPPTITMRWVLLGDGTYGVELLVSGLVSQRQAETAMEHMRHLFCGDEIKAG